uniref:SMODS and SLOG-associating 2TM effector domain-containing protein n=1 Tax=Tanacetum cinerariifolium TaxID=118510 RepID=A0A699I9X3_TANCI|nr:hypothetical protein [Tanacetum cinerariifolium]
MPALFSEVIPSPATLSTTEIAQLTAYTTAPETHSPHFRHFDAAAQQAQRGWQRLFLKSVFLLLFISLSSAVTGLGPWLVAQRYLRATSLRLFDGIGVGLTLLGVVLEVGLQLYWRRQLTPWASTRDRAEALRSAVWLYLFSLPFTTGASLSLRQLDIDQAWRHLVQDLAGASTPPLALAEEPTDELRAWRQRLQAVRPAEQLRVYRAARLNTQRQYFLRRARELRVAARRWNRVGYALLALALLWNLTRLTAIGLNWPLTMLFFNFNFFLVIIGSVALVKAYLEAEDTEPLAARYQRIADKLNLHNAGQAVAPLTPQGFRDFVLQAERILRDETTEWTARRGEQPGPATPATSVTIGFVGKRRLPAGEAPLRAALATVFNALESEFAGSELVGLSALAMGADLVFAEVVAGRGTLHSGVEYAQRVFLPASAAEFFLPADFRLSAAEAEVAVSGRLARAHAQLHAATVREVRQVGSGPDREERFAQAAFAIVDNCDLLLVACTQADKAAALADPPVAGLARGGSAETLRYAHQLGRRIILIEVDAPVAAAEPLPITTIAGRPR